MMRSRIIPLLFMLLTCYTSTNGDPCLIHPGSSDLPCVCCKTGFGGFNCTQTCPKCETRLLSGNRCKQQCKDGFFGAICNMACSVYCKTGVKNQVVCHKEDGRCFNGCTSGRFGPQCSMFCNSNCRNKECIQIDGTCNGCKEERFYGDQCTVPCSDGCYNGTCKKDGTCIYGCRNNFYGDKCALQCGANCNNHRCTEVKLNGFNCVDGCIYGFTSNSCSERCPEHCMQCQQDTGRCISCLSDYEKRCSGGDCNTGQVFCRQKVSVEIETWKIILITLVVVVAVAVVGFAVYKIAVVIWNKRNYDQVPSHDVHYKCEEGNRRIVHPKTSSKPKGRTPVMEAATKGQGKVANRVDLPVVDKINDTVLTRACADDDVKTVKSLLSNNIDRLDTRGHMGRTMVMVAAHNGCRRVFDLLVSKGCDLQFEDDNRDTVLHLACYDNDNVEIVKYLLKMNKLDINAKGLMGRTPVMIAVRNDCRHITNLLVKNGCDLSTVDDNNDPILNLACYNDNVEFVKYLFKHKLAKSNLKGYMGRNAIMIAADNGCKNVFDLLIRETCDLSVLDDNNDTILHLACYGENIGIIKHLLEQENVNINAKNSKGQTALNIAADNDCTEIHELLKSYKGCAN